MQNTLQTEGFDDDAALDETIKKLELDVKRARKKEADGLDDVIVSTVHHHYRSFLFDTCPPEEPSFPLIDVPDADVVSLTLLDRDAALNFPFRSSMKRG
jgi:actin-related protein 5